MRHARAGGDAHHVRRSKTVGIEHPNCVGRKVIPVVAGPAGFVGRRSAGVAVVVTDHEPPTVGEAPAELLLPPQHRCADAHDEKHRRIGGIAERLRAQLDPAGRDEALGHAAPRSRLWLRLRRRSEGLINRPFRVRHVLLTHR